MGLGSNGQIGDGGTDDAATPTAVTVAGTPLEGQSLVTIDSGLSHHCALAGSGTVACWGEELGVGDGTNQDRSVPTAPAVAGSPLDGTTTKELRVGSGGACAVPTTRQPACWGYGSMVGSGADGGTVRSPRAVSLQPGLPVTAPTFNRLDLEGSGIILGWSGVDNGGADITEVHIEMFEDGISLGVVPVETDDPTGAGTIYRSLSENHIYRFRATAVNVVGSGPPSALSAPVSTVAPPEGETYTPITPCRVVDTREPGAGGPFANREIRDIHVVGSGDRFTAQGGRADGCDIPGGATAVEASITAVDPDDSGFFRAWPAGQSMPNATFMNFDQGMDITNTGSIAIAPEAAGDQLRLRNFGGDSHYVVDIQGYYLPLMAPGAPAEATTSAVGDLAEYVGITPCRILDTREAGGTFTDREFRSIAVRGAGPRFAAQGGDDGGCDIPADAVSVEASITAVGPDDSGFFRAWPADLRMPNATFMNFDQGMDITNTGSLTLSDGSAGGDAAANASGDDLTIRNFGGASHYVIDIQGYHLVERPT